MLRWLSSLCEDVLESEFRWPSVVFSFLRVYPVYPALVSVVSVLIPAVLDSSGPVQRCSWAGSRGGGDGGAAAAAAAAAALLVHLLSLPLLPEET